MKIKIGNFKNNKIYWERKVVSYRILTNYYMIIKDHEIKYLDRKENFLIKIKKERKDKKC